MNIDDPRLRNLVRQAHKVAKSGKRAAATELYQEILSENPDLAEAWAGLGHVLTNKQEQLNAFTHALELDPQNKLAKKGMAMFETGQQAAPAVEKSAERTTTTTAAAPAPQAADWSAKETLQQRFDEVHPPTFDEESAIATCYRHPDRETSLRCNRCGKPICIKCANHTSVGYRCPDCLREIEAGYFTAETSDYLIAGLISIPLSIVIGIILLLVGSGFGIFFYFILFALSGAIGSGIARLTHRAIGRRRGRYIPYLVGGAVALGGIIPVLFVLLLGGGLGGLIAPGIYTFVATSAAYYQLR